MATKRDKVDEVTFEEKYNDYGEYDDIDDKDYTISSIESAPNYEEDDYEKEQDDSTKELAKKLTTIMLAIILIVIIILLLLKACVGTGIKPGNNKNGLEDKLVKAAKDYYSDLEQELPTSKGTCTKVTLGSLKDLTYLFSDFDVCDNDQTYVKVCRLESGKLQYTPIMECNGTDNDTNFDDWKEGTEADLTIDKSDVKFEYKVSYLDSKNATYGKTEEYWIDEVPYENYKTVSSTTYYRYKDKLYTWTLRNRLFYPGDVTTAKEEKTFYLKSPANNYSNSTGKATVYRWYTLTDKVYCEGKSVTSPGPNCPYRDQSTNVCQTRYSTSSWVELGKPSTTETSTEPLKYYVCGLKQNDESDVIYTMTGCSGNVNGYIYQIRVAYICAGKVLPTKNAEVTASTTCDPVPSCAAYKSQNSNVGLRYTKDSCGYYTSWSSYTTTKCDEKANPDTCKSLTACSSKWYNATKTYIGNSSPTGQLPYYETAPSSDAIKDEATKATGYKWYKLVNGVTTTEYFATSPQQDAIKTNVFKWGEWTNYSSTSPKVIKGDREIQKKVKVKIQQILTSDESSWKNVSDNYLTEEELIKKLQDLGYLVNTVDDINSNGDLRVSTKLYLRDRKY